MSRVRAAVVLALFLAGGAARAAEIRLSLVSHPGAPHVADLGEGLMVCAELAPDLPDLRAGDFELTLRPAGSTEPTAAKRLGFIARRLRGVWFFDVRALPVLDRGKYALGLLVRREGRTVATATLERKLEYLPPQLDVALIIDQSFSMRRTDPERLRVAAAKQFVDLAASGNLIRSICIVAFDERSQTLVPPTEPSERETLHKAIEQIGAFGRTDIDAALTRAHAELSRGPSARKVAVLLTDGKNEPKPYADTHRVFVEPGWPVFTIGLSDEADADVLRLIARRTGGTFHDAPTSDKLREIFSRICFALERRTLIARERAEIQAGETFALPLPIDDTISRVVFSLRSRPANVGFRVAAPGPLERPERSSTEGPFKLHAYRDPKPGQWTPSAEAADEPAEAELEVTAHTPLFPLLFPLADEYPYGEPIELVCSLADGAAPSGGADVQARLRATDGKVHSVRLADEGGGLYAGKFAPPIAPGEFEVSVSVQGTTARGFPFRRQATAASRIALPGKPELWVSADRIDLGQLHNGETGRSALKVRKVPASLPGLELRAAVEPGELPEGALELAFGNPTADGGQELSLRLTVPEDHAAGECSARLRITLGPDVARTVDLRAEVVNPRLVAVPAVLDFGEVAPGSTETRRIRLGVTGPVDVDAAVTAIFDATLPADAIDLHGKTVRLTFAGAETAIRLAVPSLGVGEYTGRLHFRGRRELGSVGIRLKVAPFASFGVEPETVELGPVHIGRRSERTVMLRSVVDSEQQIRIEAEEGAAFIAVSPDAVVLPPGGTAVLTLVCLPPLDASPGGAERLFRLTGPMLPQRLTVKADLAVPPDGTFRLAADYIPLGEAGPGDSLPGAIRITSTVDVPQRIAFDPEAAPDAGAWVAVPERDMLLPPGGTVEAPFFCSVPPDATNIRPRLRVMVRGPLHEEPVTVSVVIRTPPPGASASSRYTAPLLLLLGILLTLVLVILIIRALLEIPGHRMVKYFAASAVLNVGFFLILTQMLAVGKAIEEHYVVVRLEGPPDVAPMSPDARPDHRPLDVDARERQTEAERRRAEAADPKKDLAQAEQAKLEAQLREQERERAKLESRIDELTPDLSKLTSAQLEELAAHVRELERKVEQAAKMEERGVEVDEPRLVAQSDEQKQLEAARELALAAQKIQAERSAGALPDAALPQAESAAAKLSVGVFERLVAEAQAARRHAENSAEPSSSPSEVGAGRARSADSASRPGVASAPPAAPEGARDTATGKSGTASPDTNVSPWRGGGEPKLATIIGENLEGEAKTVPRQAADGHAADIEETDTRAVHPVRPSGDGTKQAPAVGGSAPAEPSIAATLVRAAVGAPAFEGQTVVDTPTGPSAAMFMRRAEAPPLGAEPGELRRAEAVSGSPSAAESSISATRVGATRAVSKEPAAAVGQPAPVDAAGTSAPRLPAVEAEMRGPVETLVFAARAERSTSAEAITPLVQTIERPREPGRSVFREAATIEAARSGVAETRGGKSDVAAAQVSSPEPGPSVTGKAEGAAFVLEGTAPTAVPFSAKLIVAAEEQVAVDLPGTARSTELLRAASVPAQAAGTGRSPGALGADVRSLASVSTEPFVADASSTAATRSVEERVGRGELLLAAGPGPTRSEQLRWFDEEIGSASAPAPRREHGPSVGDAQLPAREVALVRRDRAREQASSPRPEVARTEPQPALPTRPSAERSSIGQVAISPARPEIGRVPAASLLGPKTAGSVSFALVRYSGDWDCDRTAMPNLAYQLERRVGILLSTDAREIDLTDPKLLQQPFLFISGHRDFRFTDAEIAALRKYIAAGGSIWINDSTDELDRTFDIAVRRELGRLLPGHPIVRLPADHAVFKSCYDLTKGFKGYKVPPGDKYRCDHLEGVSVGGRTAIIYTRNDYGDGLEIDPNTAPLMPSLTDLSPRDMQEGSVRMGINIVLHFLGGRTGEANVDLIAEQVRTNTARMEREERAEVEAAEAAVLDNFDDEFSWALREEWGDAAEVAAVPAAATAGAAAGAKDKRMALRFPLGEKRKIVVARDLFEERDFSKHDALLMDFASELPAGCRIAVGLVTMPEWQYFESPPAYVRPGTNRNVVFRLDRPDYKCEASGWQYNRPIANRSAVRQIVILVYPICGGTIHVDNIRLAKFNAPTAAQGK